MRHSSHTRGSATEAACTPTDWATLGARILAAARQATAIHVAQTTKLHRQAGCYLDAPDMDAPDMDVVATEPDSAEPKA